MVDWLRHLALALLRPDPSARETGLLRTLLRRPPLFDLLSAFCQLKDARRQAAIGKTYAIGDEYHRDVQDYNAGRTVDKAVSRTRRAEPLFRILAETPGEPTREKLLLIGPRNVHELLLAWVHGWRWENITGIDLYSTNPKIKVMNMEAMTFADASFDAMLSSNTLAYAADTNAALSEMARVLKPGGRAVFAATYCPGEKRFLGNAVSGEMILAMLRGLGLELFHHHARDKTNALGLPQTVHYFGVRKPSGLPAFDSIKW
jgi:SAM-dependent methyltransferase